jgi:hypothetical protein
MKINYVSPMGFNAFMEDLSTGMSTLRVLVFLLKTFPEDIIRSIRFSSQ